MLRAIPMASSAMLTAAPLIAIIGAVVTHAGVVSGRAVGLTVLAAVSGSMAVAGAALVSRAGPR